MQRFRAALLALGLVTLLTGLGSGVLAAKAAEEHDHDLRLEGASGVTALDDYAERARAVALLASHSAAFANFYRDPDAREALITGETGDADLMPRVIIALKDLGTLFPDSIASASFIDRSGAENARVVGNTPVQPDELVADRRDAVFFDRAFELPYDQVYQSAPYRSESTDEWVVANAAKVNIGPGVSPAIVDFEVTLESFRLAFYSDNPDDQVRVVDLLDGRVDHRLDPPAGRRRAAGQPRRPEPALGPDGSRRHRGDPRRAAARRPARPRRQEHRHLVGGGGLHPRAVRDLVSGCCPPGRWVWPRPACCCWCCPWWAYVRHGRSMHRAARRDELTGLFNRRAARECAEAMLARERGLAVILFDLDRFKHVNDSLGHHAGDHLLAVLGQRLADVVRDPDDVVARLGGDEFVVLARGVHDDESVRVLCERLTRAVSAPVTVDGIEVSVGASIGIALAPDHGSDYGTLLQCADIAMYDAKGRRAGWQVYRDEFAGADRAGLVLDADLRRAVADGELTVHYQPSFADRTRAT